MHEIKIKPLSANEAWKGRRFKTDKHTAFAKMLYCLLPRKIDMPKGKMKIVMVFGVSSKNADGDNCIKQAQDVIAARYQFNDKLIYKWDVEKVDVKKGAEFIRFKLESHPG